MSDSAESLEQRTLLSTLYVDDTYVITNDTGAAGLSAGDTVTFANGEPGQTGGLIFGTNAFSDLQPAINAAAATGDSILVARGVYTEAATVTVNKAVTISGPQAGVDARPTSGSLRTAGSANEAVVSGGGTLQDLIQISVAGVVVDGLEFKNVTRHLITTTNAGALSGVTVQYNLIHDTTSVGSVGKGVAINNIANAMVQYNNIYNIARDTGVELGTGSSSGTVQFNEVHDLGNSGSGGTNPAIYAFSTVGANINALIKGNLVYNHLGNDAIKLGAKNGGLDRAVTGGSIIDNIVHNTFQDGITVTSSNVLVSGNEVYASASANAAIYVEAADTGVTIEYNYVHNNNTGTTSNRGVILIGDGTNNYLNTIARYNSIENNAAGTNRIGYRTGVAAANTLDAGGNWFGSSATATVQAGIVTTQANRVDFSYWLNSGLDQNPALPGFQPDLSSLTVAPSTIAPLQLGAAGRIQEAINVTTATGAITVLNGTYTEDVNVNKNVSINAAGTVNGKVSGTTGTITASGALSLGDGSTTGVNVSTKLIVGANSLTLSDSDGANLNGATSLGTSNAAPGTITAAGGIVIGSGGKLSGFGTVSGAVTVASTGELAPGASPGSMTVSSLTLNSGSIFTVEIGGLTAGTEYDQVIVTSGVVDLGNATLSPSFISGFVSATGNTFTLIDKQSGGGVTGTFNGYPEGAPVTIGASTFTISYAGGVGGNDVVLTATNSPPPSAPVITSITTDTGTSSSDGITKDTTLLISGTSAANATIDVTRVGFGFIGSTTASAGGVWTFDYTGTSLGDNTYNFTATATVAAQTSTDSAPFTVEIDTVPPAAPGTPVLSPASDTGTQGDNITRINKPFLTGTAMAGSTVVIYDGATPLGTATMSGTDWIFLVSTPLSDTVHSITAQTSDVAGNPASSGTLSLTINSALAEPFSYYVDDTLVITNDYGPAGLSTGDTVTFANAEPGQTANLAYGVNAFSNLQPAVDVAGNGDTIHMARGLYAQTATVNINKSIAIVGPQANVDARVAGGRADAIASEAIIEGQGVGNLLTISASNVELNGLDIRSAGNSLIRAISGVTYANATIHYNLIHGATSGKGIGLENMTNALIEYNQVYGVVQDTGIELSTGSANGTIRNNEVHDSGTTTTNPAIYAFSFNMGAGAYSTADINVLIEGNHVYNFNGNDAIKVGAKNGHDRNVVGGKVYDNIVNNNAEDGITVNASFTELLRNEISTSSSSNAAIYVEYAATDIMIANNSIHDNSRGLKLGFGAGGVVGGPGPANSVPLNVTVVNNSFVNNGGGNLFYNDNQLLAPGVILDASGNYWGSSTLTTVKSSLSALSGGTTRIDFTYYINNATDTDLITPGYQPDFSSLSVVSSADSQQVGATGRIQEAIIAADVGATITVLGSAYTEDVNLNKNVMVQSSGVSSLTITGNLSGTTGTLLAQDTLTIGTAVAAGVNFSGTLKTGAQTVNLIDSNGADLNGTTTLGGGTLTQSVNVINVGTATGLLNGNGTVTAAVNISSTSNLSPQNNSGTANTTGIIGTGQLSLPAGATYNVDLNGTVAGTGFDQVSVTGTVTLGGTLSATVTPSYFPQFNDQYIIILNDGTGLDDAVIGTFAGMPEGFEFVIGPALFKISYVGGDGNDVELTEIAYTTTYVNDDFANPVLGQDPDGAGPAHVFGGDAFATIQEGIDGVAVGGLVIIYDGNYPENVTINKNVTLDGETAANTVVNAPGGTAFTVTGAGNTLTMMDLKITGAANAFDVNGISTLTLTDVTTTGNTSGGIITNVTTVNYTAAGGADIINATGASLSSTGALPFDSTTLTAIANLTLNGAGGGDTFNVTPATNAQGTIITANGDANTDSLLVDTSTLTSPLHNLTGTGAGNFTSSSHQTLFYTTMENVDTTTAIPTVLNGTPGNDVYEVQLNGANLEVYVSGVLQNTLDFGSMTTLTFNGLGGNDTLLVDCIGGIPIPAGGLFLDGGLGISDKLAIRGTNAQVVVYTPDALINGNGVITIDGATITFSELEPVDFDNVGSFTLNLPNDDDLVTVTNDSNTVTTGALEAPGNVAALRFSGTSGGVGFEAAHVFRTTNVTVDTAAVVDGNDTLTIASANNGHANTNLTFSSGVGTDNLIVNGAAIVTGTFTANVPLVNLNNNITAATITGTPTVVNVNNNTAQIQDGIDVAAAGATVNVASGFVYNESPTVGKNLNLVAVGIASAAIGATTGPALTVTAGAVSLTGFDATTAAATPTISVTGGSLKLRQNSIVKSGAAPGASIVATGAGILDLGANPVAGTSDPGNNSITGAGALVSSATAVDASGNWWGTSVQPTIGAALTANVDYTPFLNSGTDSAGATPGFQSSFSDITVHTAGPQTGPDPRITESYNTLAATGTIHVLTGTYSESVNLGNNLVAPFPATDKAVTFHAGASPGQVVITGDLTLTSNDVLPIELTAYVAPDAAGPTAESTVSDNFTVTGTVTLGNATLLPIVTYGAQPFERFTIINNLMADAVVGTFAGAAEGFIYNVGGVRLRVSYVEFHNPGSLPATPSFFGDGNDVSLTVMTPPVLVELTTSGTLNITGTGWVDDFDIEVSGTNQITLRGNDVTNFQFGTTNTQILGPITVTGNINVSLGNSNDRVLLRGVGAGATFDSGNLNIDLGSGNDSVSTTDITAPITLTTGLTLTGDLSILGGTGDDVISLGGLALADTFVANAISIDTGTGGVQSVSLDRTTVGTDVTIKNGGTTGVQTVALGVNGPDSIGRNLIITQADGATGYTVGIHETNVGGFVNVTNGSGSGAAVVTIDTTTATARTIGGSTTITNGNNVTNAVNLVGTVGALKLTGNVTVKNGTGSTSNDITVTDVIDSGTTASTFTNGTGPDNAILFNGALRNTFLGTVAATNGNSTGTNDITATRLSSTKGINLINGNATTSNTLTLGGVVATTDRVVVTGNLVLTNGNATAVGGTNTVSIGGLTTMGPAGNVTLRNGTSGTGGTGVTMGAAGANPGANLLSGNLSIANLASTGTRAVTLDRLTVHGRTGVAVNESVAGVSTLSIGTVSAVVIDGKLDVQDGSSSSTMTLATVDVGSITYNDLGGGTDTINLADAAGLLRVFGVTRLNLGAGSDIVNIGAATLVPPSTGVAIFNDSVFISLGAGNDILNIGPAAASPAFSSARKFQIDGGAGVDTIKVDPISMADYTVGSVPKKLKAKLTNFENIT